MPQDSLESAGKEVGVVFPAGSRLLGVHRESGIDDLIEVKAEIPASQWAAFLAQTPIDPSLFLAGPGGLLGQDHDFWDPHKSPKLRTADARLPNGRAFNLGYDDSRASVVVVYIVNHGM